MAHIWTPPQLFGKTIFEGMSRSMTSFAQQYEPKLPKINQAGSLLCFSDYSGEEQQSNQFVYSFLIISGDNIVEWDKKRTQIRAQALSDGRRVSYKNYRDKLSRSYITQYLPIVDELNGYLITVSIDKKITSLFDLNNAENHLHSERLYLVDWSKDTVEKAFRVMHLLGLFLAGFSGTNQNILWITDNDKIAANPERIKVLTKLFGSVAAMYLTHNLGHLRVGTTSSDDGSKLIEDLCSVPDLAAGAYSDQFKAITAGANPEMAEVFWFYSPDYRVKTKELIWWLSTSHKKLCKLCFRIDEPSERKHRASFHHFFNRD